MANLNQLLDLAEQSFRFLFEIGFRQTRRVPPTSEAFRAGWSLTYSDGIEVEIEYADWEFNVFFRNGAIQARYLDLDRELFGNSSGFHGDMFPPEKLERAIDRADCEGYCR